MKIKNKEWQKVTKMTKIKDVYQEYIKRIENTSIEKSSFDILFENFLGFKNHVEVELHAFDEIEDYTLLNEQFNRLLSGEPVQYIIKKGHFYGNDFYVRVYAATGNRFSDECGTEKCGDRFGVFRCCGIFDGGGNESDCRIGKYCRERFGDAGRRCALYMDCDVFSADG